ncbi:hypothetical protein AAE478_009328 [Parahypoxylon ruwenzoriense]
MPSNDEHTPLIGRNSSQTITITTSPSRRNRKLTASMFWTLGCLYGASAVGLGAFGAHGLKKVVTDPARLANWATAAHYQLIHSVALLISSSRAELGGPNPIASTLFAAGMTLFSGSLYALVLDPARFRFLGPVTPLGGLCRRGKRKGQDEWKAKESKAHLRLDCLAGNKKAEQVVTPSPIYLAHFYLGLVALYPNKLPKKLK